MDVETIAARALQIRVSRVLLTVAAAPFYLVGFVAAALWLSGAWLFAAAQVGFADARGRLGSNGDG